MITHHSSRNFWHLVISAILCLATPAAFADDWPIVFAKLKVPSSAYGGTPRKAPSFDCQPESFDPLKTPVRPVKGKAGTYEFDGSDPATTLMVDGWEKEGDAKTVLPEPYSLTKYMFQCASGSSMVYEFKKNGERYALYTHISQAALSPDMKKLVLTNYLKPHHGGWQELSRIVEIGTRRFTFLPVMNETAFIADASNQQVVTYGLPVAASAKQKGVHRIVGIWGPSGKLIRALSVPAQTAANAKNSTDGMGLLPDEPSTFYHLTRTGENECTLRLQDIQQPTGRRSIRLTVPGAASDPAAVGARVQIDLKGLALNGGAMKYRVSASGKGDVSGDWGAWQVGK